MRQEITFYKYFLRNINGIPKIYSYGNEMGINLMVLQLLGHNLEQLFKSRNKQFSLKTLQVILVLMIPVSSFYHVGGREKGRSDTHTHTDRPILDIII
jgi:hypothetical protein